MPPSLFRAACGVCLFLVIVAAKWATFDRFGSPMPDWDQWDAEASAVLVPWLEGDSAFLGHLFAAHNEHRIVLTKLQALALTAANGQWDARLEAVVNALLHGLVAWGLWGLAARRWAGRPLALFWIVLAVITGLPLGWENVLGGFHSQQYWLLGLSVATVALLPFARAGSVRWWAGAAAAALALFSMGSGLLAAAAAGVLVAVRWARREAPARDALATLAVAAAVVGAGFLLRVEVPWHQEMKVRTATDFLASIAHSLQWPWRKHAWTSVALWLPWTLVALGRWRPRAPGAIAGPRDDHALLVVGLGGWVLLQVAATAYARGAGGGYPASRYMDTLALGVVANALALLHLHAGARPRLVRGLGLLWLGFLAAGLPPLVRDTFGSELRNSSTYHRTAEGYLRRYLATGDAAHLIPPDIPYPSVEGLVERLTIPGLRALLPVPLRTPLALVPQDLEEGIFRLNDARGWTTRDAPRRGLAPGTPALDYGVTWGSHGSEGAAARGTWRSGVLPTPGLRWLRFETAGHPGAPGVALELRAADDNRVLGLVVPSREPGDSWRGAYVRAPAVPYRIEARDESDGHWLAFSGPVEMGGLSHAAWQATKHAGTLLGIALAASLALALAAVVRRRRPAG
ncbi:MAG: hypothetical protein B9S27_02885 [Opitutia bacterium Tous-C8FEB]|nr:MAG: hypothetical protein B9S27_02885 [Opitutae bacterium Tous-C8FEB]